MKTIETERLILRKINVDDIEVVSNLIANDEELSKSLFIYSRHNDSYVKCFKDEIKRQNRKKYLFDWLVVIKDTNAPIGRISILDYSTKSNHCEIGYWYFQTYHNNGYATEALKAVIDYMFKETDNINTINSMYLSSNEASKKVMLKAGMIANEELTSYTIDKITGEAIEIKGYSIVKEDDMLCPVCGKYCFIEKYDICPVCGWEYDPIQSKDKDYKGGANKLSLNEARKVYHEKKH